ncbi:MAG: NAD-dependent epimerase/dehydratase family protein [Dysgonamonadaceae bacterium]|jgi:UDP-glucuronate 4-epimerase|nr:NAD-dependent epimerase/dehydratase family protein [Dysgonamonadaceae bacterium]
MKKILLTGAAGFIGFHIAKRLLLSGYQVIGLDSINDYYDVQLKYARLKETGIKQQDIQNGKLIKSVCFPAYSFIQANLEDRQVLEQLFGTNKFDIVCNFAAQAGVRYSIDNPDAYIQSNLVGFANILECCRHNGVKHLIYASSSSIYGNAKKIPFSEQDRVDSPISLYAATKKANELMAYAYSHLYHFQTTGLRFFTVYGPWGRPDMSPHLFTQAIVEGKPVKVFNYGNMERDFTYIDDVVDAVKNIVMMDVTQRKGIPYQIYNIGNDIPVSLLSFIEAIEIALGKKAIKELLPMQAGDVEKTWANISKAKKELNYNPKTGISQGIDKFVNWYKVYYNKD